MCNCVKQIEDRALEKLKSDTRFKKPVKGVKLLGRTLQIDGGTLRSRTTNTLSIELEGQKKRVEMPVAHSYCPFCGEKAEAA